eukprot:TRINITY_DN15538_c0_g1_i5.p2 TRINITY_DN15538_c0_g1~~TRINITY_DN15538_c0_g1_i5.p2  ORF type:complete len:142 (-),score=54.42 TRINITY_DN15538_c0_g1_i5:162-587(-)
MEVWDTGGQERFKTIAKTYYDRAMAVLLIYDCTNERSFVDINNWLRQIDNHAHPDILKVLVASKCDMEEERVITKEMGDDLAKKLDIAYFETSAKYNMNVDKLFEHIAQEILGKDAIVRDLGNSMTLKEKKLAKRKSDNCC